MSDELFYVESPEVGRDRMHRGLAIAQIAATLLSGQPINPKQLVSEVGYEAVEAAELLYHYAAGGTKR